MNIKAHLAGDSVVLDNVLAQRLSNLLAGSTAKLQNLIMNLSSQAGPKMDRVYIPVFSGLQVEANSDGVSTIGAGTNANAGNFDASVLTLLLNKRRKVEIAFGDQELDEASLDKVNVFWFEAPRYLVKEVEDLVADILQIPTKSTGTTIVGQDYSSSAAATGNNRNGEYVFTLADIAKAQRVLNVGDVPEEDRVMAPNSVQMEQFSSMTEFQDGSKSLSDEALRKGVVSIIKGFQVIRSESMGKVKDANYFNDAFYADIGRTTSSATSTAYAANEALTCFHKDCAAIAIKQNLQREVIEDRKYSQTICRVSMWYGAALLDPMRKVTIRGTLQTGA